MTQEEFWRARVRSRPPQERLAYIEGHFPGTYGCGWEEGIFYPLSQSEVRIFQTLWEETYAEVFGRRPDPQDGPAYMSLGDEPILVARRR